MAHPICGSRRDRGSLILVVLCLLAVLGIALASFLAIGNQSMKLSNRSYRTSVSAQLAEMGIEEALRAFNTNNWADWSINGTSADWSTSGTTASCTITFPATKFGQGVTGTVKIRVDNYNANQLNSAWISSANYRADNLVSYTDGKWYRSTNIQSNKIPSVTSGYWIQEHSSASNSVAWMSWTNGASYTNGSMATRNGYLYRCISSHTSSSSNAPPNGSYWLNIPYATFGSDLQYSSESMVFWSNATWYRYTGSTWVTTGTGMPPRWYYNSGTTYSSGDTVRSGTTWYRYINSTPSAGYPLNNGSYWETAQSLATTAAAAWNWTSTNSYNLNDVVYYSSRWYRSLAAGNTNNTPSASSAYWSASPSLSRIWDSSRQYSQYDTVYYNGVWYLSLQSSNYDKNPSTQTSYWIGANTTNASYTWNASTSYSVGNYRCYGGGWYKCLSAGSNKTPNNSSYWTSSWAQSSGVTTGAPVIYAEGRVTLPDNTAAIKTQLRVAIAPAPLFPNALAATSTLTVSGGGTIDSYDSTIGTYNVSGNLGYSAVLAATGTTNPAVTVTSTTVNGYVAAPSNSTTLAPMWSYGGSAVLQGSPSGSGIDLTRVSRSPYIPQFDIKTVAGGTQLSTTTATLGTPGATTPSVYYYNNAGIVNMVLNTSSEVITIVGPVILNVTGNFRIYNNSGAKLVIAPTGSLRLVVARDFNIESTGGGIDNQTLDPSKLTVLCSRSGLDTFSYAAAQNFYGTIYVPNSSSALTIGSAHIYGALSAQNITFSGDANVHYDTSLRYATIPGVDQPWAVTEWRELTDPAERAVLP